VGKHEKTLQAMLQHPKPSNLRWTDVESLLEHFGAEIKERKGSAIGVTLNGHKAWFHRPHPGDKADKGAIANTLEFLKKAGIKEAQ
jgi:hypothetical protein